MEYALITGGTSGIGKEVSNFFLDKGISVIITGSRDTYKIRKNEIYIKNDQANNGILSQKIVGITKKIKYVFLNTGIFIPDDGDKNELMVMKKINYQSTIEILHDLYENHLIENARVIINASIQAKQPREFAKEYAKTKKDLSDESIRYAEKNDIHLSVIGLSVVKDTPMLKRRMNYSISKGIYTDENDFLQKNQLTEISEVIDIIENIFFGIETVYTKEFMHKFVSIHKA